MSPDVQNPPIWINILGGFFVNASVLMGLVLVFVLWPVSDRFQG